MLFQYGDVDRLVGKPWNIVELRSEGGCEGTIRRIGKELPGIFKNDPVEVFIPVGKRDLGKFEIKTETYIFLRSLDPKKVVQIRQVTGVVWCVCHGQGTSVDRLIYLEDLYIQDLIKQAEIEFDKRADDVDVHSFVRIIDGYARDYCGQVISIDEGVAHVWVKMETLELIVETPIKNLLVLHPEHDQARVFYYRDLLDEYYDEYPNEPLQSEALEGRPKGQEDEIMPVVRTGVDKLLTPEVSIVEVKKRYSKQHTATALAHRAVDEGVVDPHKLISLLIESINNNMTRPVKNVVILIGVTQAAITHALNKTNPEIKTYKDVITTYGSHYRLDPQTIGAMIPWLPIKTDPKDIKPRRPRKVKEIESSTGAVGSTTIVITDNLPG